MSTSFGLAEGFGLAWETAAGRPGSPATTARGRQSKKLVFRGAYNNASLKFDTPQLHQ